MRLLPTLAGILLIGAEGYVLGEAMWSPCPCQAWAGDRCVDSVHLVPLTRCEPYRLIANSEPKPDRLDPVNRVQKWIVRDFYQPADANLDGGLDLADVALFAAGPWDFDGDGAVSAADLSAFVAEYQRGPCPRLAKGTP